MTTTLTSPSYNMDSPFLAQVREGMLNKNVGLSSGIPKIDKHLNGIQRGTYYIIGAESGSFKTTIADYITISMVRDAIKREIPLRIFYFSFEISKTQKLARWLSHFIYLQYKIMIPADRILGRIRGRTLNAEEYKKVEDAYKVLDKVLSYIHIVEQLINPTSVYEEVVDKFYSKKGIIYRWDRTNPKSHIINYTPYDPRLMVVLIVDHVSLFQSEKGMKKKEVIDRASTIFMMLRNIFKTTIIALQQFSTDMLMHRRTLLAHTSKEQHNKILTPSRLDLADSKDTFRDADIVLGLVKPLLYDIKEAYNYNILPASKGGIGENLLFVYIIKNRFGKQDFMLSLYVNPVVNNVSDMVSSDSPEIQKYHNFSLLLWKENEKNYPI